MIQIAILLLFVVVIPLLFIWEIAFKKHANITSWILSVVVLAMVLIWATGSWHIVSIYLRNIFTFLFLVACIVGYQRIIKPLHSKKYSSWGDSPLLNHHLTVKPQNYAPDIVRIGHLGTRTVSLMGGSALEDYALEVAS